MCLVSAVLGIAVVLTEVLCSWTGSDTDRSTDQSSFAEAHSAVIDCQVPHTAHIGLLGGDALWEEMIWEEEDCMTWWERCGVGITGVYLEDLCCWLTWSSTDEHWLFGICGAGIQRSHHMVDLRVHIQLDNVGISDHCNQARHNALIWSLIIQKTIAFVFISFFST